MHDRVDDTTGERSALPAALEERLREIIRRVRRLQRARGLLATLVAAVLSLLAVMGVDAALDLQSPVWRSLLSGGALAAAALVFWKKLARPLRRPLSPLAVARWLEVRRPELKERISTALELSGKETAASAALLDAVLEEAAADVKAADLTRELGPDRLRFWKAAAIASVLALLTPLALWPRPAARLLIRAVLPLADDGNAWADDIRLLTGDQIVAIGEPVEIRAVVAGKAEKVEILIENADGTATAETLKPDPAAPPREDGMEHVFRNPAVAQSFTARLRAGRAVGAPVRITAVERPAVRAMTVVYDFPEYTGLPDATVEEADGPLEAVAGTRVTVRARTKAEVERAEVLLAARPVEGVEISKAPDGAGGSVVSWTTVLTPGLNTVWRLRAEAAGGLTAETPDFPVRALEDRPPVVTLESPERNEVEVRPGEKLPLVYSVVEDFGFSSLTLRVSVPGKGETLMDRPLPERDPADASRWTGVAVLDLEELNPGDATDIRANLVATDTRPADMGGPGTGASREILIRVRRDARSRLEQAFLAQHEVLRKAMDATRDELHDAKRRLDDAAGRLDREERLDEHTLKQIEESAKFARRADERLRELAEQMRDTAFAKQSGEVERIADEMTKPAAEQARDIPLTDDKRARSELAEQARKKLEEALKSLEDERRKLEEDRDEVARLAQLADVAERQRMLANVALEAKHRRAAESSQAEEGADAAAVPGESPAATGEEDRKWVEEQRRVTQRAREFMEQLQGGGEQSGPQKLEESAAKARGLAEYAESLAKRQAEALERTLAASAESGRSLDANAAEEARRNQAEVTQAALELQERAAEFQQEAQRLIDQSSASQDAAWEAQVNIQNAVKNAQRAEEELAGAIAGGRAETPEDRAERTRGEEGGAEQAANPAENTAHPLLPQEESKGEDDDDLFGEAGNAAASGGAEESEPETALALGESAATPKNEAERAEDSGLPPAPGATPGTDARASLESAAEALKGLSQALEAQAGVTREHGQSLREGAELAGRALEEADRQGERPPDMARGADAARQAADRLAQAAETAMEARGVPESARNPQGKGPNRRGSKQGQTSRGGANPGGRSGNELQPEGGARGLPPELERLGLTPGDWAKLKSVISGAEGAQSERVPEEYRELVKAYFGALAREGENPDRKEEK